MRPSEDSVPGLVSSWPALTMPLKPYLKLYLLLLAAVLAVSLLCYGLVHGLNQVRHQAWLESLPKPLLSWLSDHPDVAGTIAAGPGPGQWALLTEADLNLDAVALERLLNGQVLAFREGDGVRWLYRLHHTGFLQLFVKDPYRDLAEIQAKLLADLVEQGTLSLDQSALGAFATRLGVMARPVQRLEQVPGQEALERLSREGRAFVHDQGEAAQIYMRLQAPSEHAGLILRVAMPAPYDPLGWPILLLVLAIVATVLASLTYALLSRLHRGLRNVENVAARIARGELDARVRSEKLSIVDRLGGAFNRMADHIQRLVDVQREMIHAVSHELRTPVARIRFGVQMLEDSDGASGREAQLAGIDADIQELDELIDEILTYARLEQGGPIFSFQDVDVAQVIDQVIAEQRQTRPELAIESDFQGGVERWSMSDAEPRYLHRAVQNLVGNATRYARSRVKVTGHFDAGTCRVDVEDDGAGIPEADWDKVFTAFARLDDSRTRKSGGYGLGLSIVRRILYWHGGQAFVGRSDSLGGARFSLVWPRRQPNLGTSENP